MIRTINSKSRFVYSSEDEPIVFSKSLLDQFLDQPHAAELFLLYSYYYYTAKWQKTNRPWATNLYVAQRLGWNKRKVMRYRVQLRKMGLIKNIQLASGKIVVHVYFVWSQSKSRITGVHKTDTSARIVHPNALSVNSSISKKIYKKTFLQYLPVDWQQNTNLKAAITSYIIHRLQRKSKLTPIQAHRLASKLARFPIETAIAALEESVENGWTGVFPRKDKSQPSKVIISPNKLLKKLFGKDDDPRWWNKLCVRPALNLMPTKDDETRVAIIQGMANIKSWYKSRQHPPKDDTDTVGKYGYSSYRRWETTVPGPMPLIQQYIAWLQEQQWLDAIEPRLFEPTSKVFLKFLAHYQHQLGVNFFTGAQE